MCTCMLLWDTWILVLELVGSDRCYFSFSAVTYSLREHCFEMDTANFSLQKCRANTMASLKLLT